MALALEFAVSTWDSRSVRRVAGLGGDPVLLQLCLLCLLY